MISLQFDPFDSTTILQSEMETYVFSKILKKMDRLLVSKILAHHVSHLPFSLITFMDNDHMKRQLFNDLEDPRQIEFLESLDKNIYLTPNFLQTFDFTNCYDETIINSKASFSAL